MGPAPPCPGGSGAGSSAWRSTTSSGCTSPRRTVASISSRSPPAARDGSRSATFPPPSTRPAWCSAGARSAARRGPDSPSSDFGYNHAPVTILWDTYRSALGSIAQAVGRTPLVTLSRVIAGVTPPIHAKLEWYSATGSLKDRIYLHMFERAEARGDLRPGMRVLECSTGNAGIACAFVAAVKGYRCTIVMPEGMSDERKKIMRAYGADLVFTPGGESDVDLSLRRQTEIRAGDPTGYWVPGQFDHADNIDVTHLSGVITTTTAESLAMARRLAAEEGIFCGISTGCNVAAALKLAQRRPDLPSIVTMVNDTGQRYFTTALCGEDKHVEVPEREHPMDPH